LMEGLESYAGLLELGSTDEPGDARMNAMSPNGRPYRSIVDGRAAMLESKGDW